MTLGKDEFVLQSTTCWSTKNTFFSTLNRKTMICVCVWRKNGFSAVRIHTISVRAVNYSSSISKPTGKDVISAPSITSKGNCRMCIQLKSFSALLLRTSENKRLSRCIDERHSSLLPLRLIFFFFKVVMTEVDDTTFKVLGVPYEELLCVQPCWNCSFDNSSTAINYNVINDWYYNITTIFRDFTSTFYWLNSIQIHTDRAYWIFVKKRKKNQLIVEGWGDVRDVYQPARGLFSRECRWFVK